MPELAQKLDEIVPVPSPTRTHFANSGTEAVETALKLAMHATGREKFIAFFNSFHGRTLGSLSLTSSKAAQRLGFKRQALDVVHVPYPNEFRNPFSEEDCGDGGAGQGALNWIEERLFKTTTPPRRSGRRSSSRQCRAKVATCRHRRIFCKACAASAMSTASC